MTSRKSHPSDVSDDDVKDYERSAQTLADLYLVAFACIMLKNVAILAAGQ